VNVAVSIIVGTAAGLLAMKVAQTGQTGMHWINVEMYTILLSFIFIGKLWCDL
jgi:hypothetical protein